MKISFKVSPATLTHDQSSVLVAPLFKHQQGKRVGDLRARGRRGRDGKEEEVLPVLPFVAIASPVADHRSTTYKSRCLGAKQLRDTANAAHKACWTVCGTVFSHKAQSLVT